MACVWLLFNPLLPPTISLFMCYLAYNATVFKLKYTFIPDEPRNPSLFLFFLLWDLLYCGTLRHACTHTTLWISYWIKLLLTKPSSMTWPSNTRPWGRQSSSLRQSKTGKASDSSKVMIFDAAYNIKATSLEKNKQKVVICKILFF